MTDGLARRQARRYGQTAGLLSIGVGAAGVLTYAYFALASHGLDKTQYGEIVVLWAAVFVIVSTVFRPIEQLLSRTIAERDAAGLPIVRPLRIAATIQLALAVAFAAIALALRDPLQDGLLKGDSTLFWVLVTAVPAYAASFYARGLLAGSRRFRLYSALLITEAISRAAFALAVVIGFVSGHHAVALGVVLGPCLSLVVVPLGLRRGRDPGPGAGPGTVAHASADQPATEAGARGGAVSIEPELTLAHGSGFAAAVLLMMISEQTFLNAGPLLIRGSEGAAAAGFIFNVLMVARAPVVLFLAIATSLLPHLTRLRSFGATGEEGFRLSIRATLMAIAVFTAAAVLVVAAAGPQLMQIAFGSNFEYDRGGLVIVAVGMGFYLSAATLNQAALAQGQAHRAATRWVVCAIVFLAWNLSSVVGPFRAVETGFAGSAALLCGLLYLVYRRPITSPGDVIAPGSPEEIEARLAAADEAG